MRRKRVVLTMIVALVVTNLATYALATGAIPWVGYRLGPSPLPGVSGRDFSRLVSEYILLTHDYVEPVEGATLLEGALKGMAEALGDPYTYYMNARESEDFDITLAGEYVGVGMVVEPVGEFVTVVSPMPGRPAERGGLRPLDRILAVDGRGVVGVPSEVVVGLIRGQPGTPVTLTIGRGPQESETTMEVELVRETIVLESAAGRMLFPSEGIGYIQMTEFSRKTPAQFSEALAALRSQGLKGLILDLRNNGGGYLDECVTIANSFIPQGGTILHRVGRDGRRNTVTAADGRALGLPVVVLINEGTASAAEILAGAIKDNKVGTLVGVTSFGKGTVQSRYDLEGGSALRLTTERWLTPNGEQITGKGIAPDAPAELPKLGPEEEPLSWSNPEDPRDTQLRRALEIVRGATGPATGG